MIIAGSAGLAQKKEASINNLLLFHPGKINAWQSFLLKKNAVLLPALKPVLPADFYSKQLGFFCKKEIKFDKVTRIPFRFRLGSVEQCNWLEGKIRQD